MLNSVINILKLTLQAIFSPEMGKFSSLIIERKVQKSVSILEKRRKVINLCLAFELLLTVAIALLLLYMILILIN